ncbi:hypothetical protein [Methanococcoides burtonii]|uniref:hypothetical protein n=1 Tax=Methanococcoides burtonii TaxID=29291 RepID=UPI00005444D5|nr:hypothetical protein [Methanococcoides burtonii]
MNEIGREFMDRTKFQYAERSDQSMGYPQPPLQKGAGGREVIELPAPGEINVKKIDLREAIEGRSSFRNYSQEPFSRRAFIPALVYSGSEGINGKCSHAEECTLCRCKTLP